MVSATLFELVIRHFEMVIRHLELAIASLNWRSLL